MARASRLLTAVAVLLAASTAVFAEIPEILDFGTEEYLGVNGRLSSIDVDSKNQPHIVSDGGTFAYFYDKVGTTWQFTAADVSPYRQFYNPHLEIGPTDIAWVSGIMVGPGFGFFTRLNVSTAPTAPNFSGGYLVEPVWDAGMLSIDPGTPDYMVASSARGNWDKFIYDASAPGGIRGVAQGQLYAYNGGEKNAFWISKAGNVNHPASGVQAVWHGCTDTQYQNSYRQDVFGFGSFVEWASWGTYQGMWDDGAYPTIVSDLEEPQVAYLGHALEGNGGILLNIWQGNDDGSGQMLRSSGNLLAVDPSGSSGLRRYGVQSCAAKGGGAWFVWTRGGRVIVMYMASDGTQGQQYDIAPGTWCDIVADDKGDLHLVYNYNGVRYRKMDVSGSAEGSSFAADFDGNGLDDIAVFRPTTGRWYIFHSGTESQSNVLWGGSDDMPVPADYNGDGSDEIAVWRPGDGKWYIRNFGTIQWGTNTDYPVPADYNGDGTNEVAVFRPDNGNWYIRRFWTTPTPSNRVISFGTTGDLPVPGDYTGDGLADVGVFRPAEGKWYVSGLTPATGWLFGVNGDIPAQADYDGDGTIDVAVFNPPSGTWYYKSSANGFANRSRAWGASGDIPVPGKFASNTFDSIAVYRPSNSKWYVRDINGAMKIYEPPVTFGVAGDTLVPYDYRSDGTTDIATFSGGMWYIRNIASIAFGAAGDTPVPADYDGDGTNDTAVFRPSNGTWYYWSSLSNMLRQVTWGAPTDTPVPGKWTSTNRNTVAVWRPSNGTWYIRGFGNVAWGGPGDIPVPADYDNDGDTEIAVFRPGNGTWYIRGFGSIPWGGPGDIPVPADYDNDGDVEIAVFRPSNGTWYRQGMANVQFGGPGDTPRPGDYDGDGLMDLAVTRENGGQVEWWVFGSQAGLIKGSPKAWGATGDLPIGGRR